MYNSIHNLLNSYRYKSNRFYAVNFFSDLIPSMNMNSWYQLIYWNNRIIRTTWLVDYWHLIPKQAINRKHKISSNILFEFGWIGKISWKFFFWIINIICLKFNAEYEYVVKYGQSYFISENIFNLIKNEYSYFWLSGLPD